MHITGDINLGSILTIVTLIGIAIAMGSQLGKFELTLKHHADTMSDHAARLVSQETRIGELVASVQRLMGRMEGEQARRDAAVK